MSEPTTAIAAAALATAMPTPQQYVLGFMFDGKNVLMIRKARPDFLAGKLNGLGGKVEPGENGPDAMAREFREESGIESKPDDWQFRGVVNGIGFTINLYTAEGNVWSYLNVTDELLCIVGIDTIPTLPNLAPNLEWIVPALRAGVNQLFATL